MRDLPLTLLRTLAAVHAEGGVRPAARHLGITHSAVSRALRDLSLWLGTPVVKPRTQGAPMALTAQATMLAEVALRNMGELQAAVRNIREAGSARSVVIATQPSVASRWLMPLIEDLQTACPGVEVSIVVEEGRLGPIDPSADLTVRMGERQRTKLKVHDLSDDVAFPVIAAALWEEVGRPYHLRSLRDLRLLHDRDTRASWARWRAEIGPKDVDIRHGPRFTTSDLVLSAAEAGQGVALVRGMLASRSIAEGKLKRLFDPAAINLPAEWWIAEGKEASAKSSAIRVRDWFLAQSVG